jgi:nucleotide-binding universal stress UspA family protein
MTQAGPIVCATDLSATGALAIDLAAKMAHATGRTLHVIHADAPALPEKEPENEAERVLRARVQAQIEAAVLELEKERARAESLAPGAQAALLEGRPWEAIVHYAARVGASLVVVGPHGALGPRTTTRSAVTEHILGTTADRVVRHAPCAVLVGPRDLSTEVRVDGRWLAALDLSPRSHAILLAAKELAQRTGATIAPVHAVAHVEQAQAVEEFGRENGGALCFIVQQVLGEEAGIDVGGGDPVSLLASIAEDAGVTMIVVGTRGRTGLANLVLGSTAERLLRRSPVPILCVRV